MKESAHTHHIDSGELSVNRMRHRPFLSIPALAALGSSAPVCGTRDDHDFGGNNTDGMISHQEVIRQALTEYPSQRQLVDGQHHVYTMFRRGPVEFENGAASGTACLIN